jgi:hypothetical protein
MAEFKSAPTKVETAHYESYPDGQYSQGMQEKGVSTAIEDTETSDNSQVHNVLAHLTREELLTDVDRFATQHGLDYAIDDLRKGALLAQKPQHYMSLPEGTHTQVEAPYDPLLDDLCLFGRSRHSRMGSNWKVSLSFQWYRVLVLTIKIVTAPT